jgi:ankyrin repeat protein
MKTNELTEIELEKIIDAQQLHTLKPEQLNNKNVTSPILSKVIVTKQFKYTPKKLLSEKKLNTRDLNDYTPIFWACWAGVVETCQIPTKYLNSTTLTQQNNTKETPLYWLCFHRNLTILTDETLLKIGISALKSANKENKYKETELEKIIKDATIKKIRSKN